MVDTLIKFGFLGASRKGGARGVSEQARGITGQTLLYWIPHISLVIIQNQTREVPLNIHSPLEANVLKNKI